MYCSISCSSKGKRADQGHPPFSKDEDDLIEEMAGSRPVCDIHRAINRLNKKNGKPPRSERSVRHRLMELGLSARCMDDNLNLMQLGELLGVNRTAIRNWSQQQGLPIRKISIRRNAVRLADFRRWAREHEEMLYGLKLDGLKWVLDDRDWAMRLHKEPFRGSTAVAVRRLDTLQKYSSLTQLYQQTGIKLRVSAIKAQLDGNNRTFTARGITWEVLK